MPDLCSVMSGSLHWNSGADGEAGGSKNSTLGRLCKNTLFCSLFCPNIAKQSLLVTGDLARGAPRTQPPASRRPVWPQTGWGRRGSRSRRWGRSWGRSKEGIRRQRLVYYGIDRRRANLVLSMICFNLFQSDK